MGDAEYITKLIGGPSPGDTWAEEVGFSVETTWTGFDPSGSDPVLYYYNGSSWVAVDTATIYYYDGADWVNKPIYYYTGSAWVLIPND